MKIILITDTHYGIKQNSITWMNAQLDFIYNELIPYIKSIDDDIMLIHCGDVFDSRSSINPFIAKNVRYAFKELVKVCNNGMYIIAGNHDYYSPTDDTVTALELILNDIPEIHIIHDDISCICPDKYGNMLLAPWYEFEKYEKLKQWIDDKKPKSLFCHADLTMLPDGYMKLLKGINIYSGHIHTPHHTNRLHTLGSTYALTFADCNSERGFYVLDEDYNLEFHPAKNIIKFWRYKNDEIFDIDVNKIKNDYVELYIDKINLLNDVYTEKIKKITSKVHNIVIIPNDNEQNIDECLETFDNYNIEKVCLDTIPDELKDKFNQIIKISNNDQL